MPRTGALKHTHQYRKEFNGIWRCATLGCTHYMPLNIPNGILGKKCICWNCKSEFYLDEDALQMSEPICYDCRHPQSKIIIEKIDELDDILVKRGIK